MYTQPFHQRVVAGTAATISWLQLDSDGEPADPGTVTIGITRADGTILVASGTATGGTGAAVRTYALSAANSATLDRLTVTWTASGVVLATTVVDIVAAPWFSNAELRAAEVAVSNSTTYSAPVLAAARRQVETFFERVTHRRFVVGYSYETLRSSESDELVLPAVELRRVRSVAIYGSLADAASVTFTADELAAIPADAAGVARLNRGAVWGYGWVKIGWEHGFLTPPLDVKREAMRLTRYLIVNQPKTDIPENATSITQTELGFAAVLITPGVKGAWTYIPSVNECLDAWTFDEVGVA